MAANREETSLGAAKRRLNARDAWYTQEGDFHYSEGQYYWIDGNYAVHEENIEEVAELLIPYSEL